jgi:positive regulator of sigma E activity
LASRAATVVSVGSEGVSLSFSAPCTGCEGCAGRCRAFRLYESRKALLTLPRHLFPDHVAVGHDVQVAVADADLRRLATRAYAGTLGGLLAGACLAGVLAFLAGWRPDPMVLAGAVLGSLTGWVLARPGAVSAPIEIQATPRGSSCA